MDVAQTFTRKEFHELVWSRPLTQLAKDFALSDVALHKICKKHNIPHPPLGWWAKKHAGQSVKIAPLPKAKAGMGGTVTIAGGDLSRETPSLAAVRENARILAASEPEPADSNPIVVRTIRQLKSAKPSEKGLINVEGPNVIQCEITKTSIDRLEACLPQIVAAASAQGFRLVSGERRAKFENGNEAIGFAITEAIRREKHVLTPKELAEDEAARKKRERRWSRNEWDDLDFDGPWPYRPQWDYHPSGQLALEFDHHYFLNGATPRRGFKDAKIQRFENLASDIAIGLAVYAAALADDAIARDEKQKQEDEERRIRDAPLRKKHIYERRRSALGVILEEVAEIDQLTRLIGSLDQHQFHDPSPRVASFIAWSHEFLEMRRDGLSSEKLEMRFGEEHLFGDDDDNDFRSPPYYHY